jgi:hypothetical protein
VLAELPGTARALTAPLSNGEALGVLDGLGGLSFSLLGSNDALAATTDATETHTASLRCRRWPPARKPSRNRCF